MEPLHLCGLGADVAAKKFSDALGDVDAFVAHSKIHGTSFGVADENLERAPTAKLADGGTPVFKLQCEIPRLRWWQV